ncbi:MAG: hypothetical protein DMG98_09860 [Acidobacteria bacterium]|nr:MAG: hypothetical protein DMG98_09860 [Acidobacteriota bacterium]
MSNVRTFGTSFFATRPFTVYVNRLYFGENLIGVHDASHYFFRKDSNELNIAEAALLAGLVRSPSRFSPLDHPDRALRRRNEVIDVMLSARTIDAAGAQSARSSGLGIAQQGMLKAN